MAPDGASSSSSSNLVPQDPQSLQDLQKMRVDDLIKWLSQHKAEGLPPRAPKADTPRQDNRGVKATKLKEAGAKEATAAELRPMKRPYLRKDVSRQVLPPAAKRTSGLSERNAARFHAFDEEIWKQKSRLKVHAEAYDNICEEIRQDMEVWQGMMAGDNSSDAEPEYIYRSFFPEYTNCESGGEEEESWGCRFLPFKRQ